MKRVTGAGVVAGVSYRERKARGALDTASRAYFIFGPSPMRKLTGKASLSVLVVSVLLVTVGGLAAHTRHQLLKPAANTASSATLTAANRIADSKSGPQVSAPQVSISLTPAGTLSSTPSTLGPKVLGATPLAKQTVAEEQRKHESADIKAAQLPLSFTPNKGQLDAGIQFEARSLGYTVALTNDGAVLGVHTQPKDKTQAAQAASVKVDFAGAKLNLQAQDRQASYSNYYIGNDPSKWYTKLPNYARLHASDLYPGIDATFYGNQTQLEYDLTVAPGADPSAIQLKFEGAQKLSLKENGDLEIATTLGPIVERKPVMYQDVDGARQNVEGGYKLDGNTVTFEIASYDSSKALVIDPTTFFMTFVGGINSDLVNGVAVDQNALYIAGTSNSVNLGMLLPGPNSGAFPSGNNVSNTDAIVMSMSQNGTFANWYSFIGGNSNDQGNAIAVPDATVGGSGGCPGIGAAPNR